MNRPLNIALTGLAPMIWGSSYIVITQLLPDGYPLMSAAIRALPAGLLLLLFSPKLPTGEWWWKTLVLGALNFSVFWWLLFVAAYRLPGGVAATLGAMQPLIVVFAAFFILNVPIRKVSISSAILGIFGVALLLLTAEAGFDLIGIIAGFGGAASMALGVVLTRKWQPPVPLLRFTAWQLIAGGLLLLPFAIALEPNFPAFTMNSLVGYGYLSIIGGALTYIIWFRGIATLDPNTISPLGFLSPLMAVLMGWLVLNQSLTYLQILGTAIVLLSIWLATRKPADG
ncbi:EamA family transporter [Lentilitoribacter sp. Alg239-R112]|uniref:EamA family transporter n=1 Tax=Lentilitoribacter sp. Alg239-R112 TaxID=2305987 RepID=UPI0013A70857|nr:EamA family transporter [Lentilitoribacter sp. Alg239-R112]